MGGKENESGVSGRVPGGLRGTGNSSSALDPKCDRSMYRKKREVENDRRGINTPGKGTEIALSAVTYLKKEAQKTTGYKVK